jgi:signal peptidase II
MSLTKKAFGVIGIILAADQALKILIKTSMHLDERISVFGDWFYILFTENPGMAYGMSFGGPTGKILLVLFRMALALILLFYLPKIARKEEMTAGFVIGLAGICAGALGNIVDSAFYGLVFDSGTTYNANFGTYLGYSSISRFSLDGYSSFLHGCVVDMLYFPIVKTTYPSWFPFCAGEEFIFFRPIFNIADSAISVSAAYIFLFQRRTMNLLFRRNDTAQQC